jgi:hypothetical protein
MIECFGVFSKVIALLCMGSQCATVPTLWVSHRRIDAGPGWARARQVGEASIAQSAPRASRRGIAERWQLSLPAPRLEYLVDHHPKRQSDSRLESKPVECGEPVGCGIEKPPRDRNLRCVHNRAGTQTNPTTCPSHVEFIVANRLFASLVLRQVRRGGSTTSPEQGTGSSRKRGSELVAVSAIESPSASAPPATTDQAASAPVAASIETLFAELARSRLSSFATDRRIPDDNG